MLLQHSHTTISATPAKLRKRLFLSHHIKQKTSNDIKFKFNNNSLLGGPKAIHLFVASAHRGGVLSCSSTVFKMCQILFCFECTAGLKKKKKAGKSKTVESIL